MKAWCIPIALNESSAFANEYQITDTKSIVASLQEENKKKKIEANFKRQLPEKRKEMEEKIKNLYHNYLSNIAEQDELPKRREDAEQIVKKWLSREGTGHFYRKEHSSLDSVLQAKGMVHSVFIHQLVKEWNLEATHPYEAWNKNEKYGIEETDTDVFLTKNGKRIELD